MRVIVVVAASSWALCSRPGSLSVTGAKTSEYWMTYLGAFGENTCPGGGQGANTSEKCQAWYPEYCPNPIVACGGSLENFIEANDAQLPPGCSVDGTQPLYNGEWDYDYARKTFNSADSASFPSNYKKLCRVKLWRCSYKTMLAMNKERQSKGNQPLTMDYELTRTAFAVALNAYKNLTAGQKVKSGYSFRDGWDGNLIVDTYGPVSGSKGADVVIFRGKARKCNSGTEANYAVKMVQNAFAKKKILRTRLYKQKYTSVGSARICTGRKGKASGSIEVVMFA